MLTSSKALVFWQKQQCKDTQMSFKSYLKLVWIQTSAHHSCLMKGYRGRHFCLSMMRWILRKRKLFASYYCMELIPTSLLEPVVIRH